MQFENNLNIEALLFENKLNIDNPLFKNLQDKRPDWFNNLCTDPGIYWDVRNDNSLNCYYNGGSIMDLKWVNNNYQAKIHYKYITVNRPRNNYVDYVFDNNVVTFNADILNINNFDSKTLTEIKERIKNYYPDSSEKGIQGKYATSTTETRGFFLDSEFAYTRSNLRLDLVYADTEEKKIYFVELKTICDARLYNFGISNSKTDVDPQNVIKTPEPPEGIYTQLKKYKEFVTANKDVLEGYYKTVFKIKKNLGLLKLHEDLNVENIDNYTIETKPILLIGNATTEWINANIENRLIPQLSEVCFAIIARGPTTNHINLSLPGSQNIFRF